MSSTGPTAKRAKKQFDCDCLKVLLETYVHKRIFDASFEDNKGKNGSNKTLSDLYQERVEPAMPEWYHVFVEDCLNTSQQISTRLDENGYSLNAAQANMQPRVTQTLKVYQAYKRLAEAASDRDVGLELGQ